MFELVVFLAGAFGGAVASVAGFGIGSLLTPAIATATGAKLAVAAVSIPHVIGTSIRFWRLRQAVDWTIVRSFGMTSAAGGVAGALLNTYATSRSLALVFGSLLVLAGASQVTGYAGRWRLRGTLAWFGGALSGFFGGLVGNQGGIRTAAMLGFDVEQTAVRCDDHGCCAGDRCGTRPHLSRRGMRGSLQPVGDHRHRDGWRGARHVLRRETPRAGARAAVPRCGRHASPALGLSILIRGHA